MSSGSVLQMRARSESVILLHPESMMMFEAPDTIKDYTDARGLGCHLGPY